MQYLLLASHLILAGKRPKALKAQWEQLEAKQQEWYAVYVAQLETIINKPLASMTWAEFIWLTSRCLLPIGESPKSNLRRRYLQFQISEQDYRNLRAAQAAVEQGQRPRIPTIEEGKRAVFQQLVEGKQEWPDDETILSLVPPEVTSLPSSIR